PVDATQEICVDAESYEKEDQASDQDQDSLGCPHGFALSFGSFTRFGSLDYRLPTTLVAQDQLDDLADRARSARSAGDIMSPGQPLGACIRDRDAQAAFGQHRQIGDVVADISRLLRPELLPFDNRTESGQLVLSTFDENLQAQFGRTRRRGRRPSPCD